MGEPSTFVGMDVHKQVIAVAMLVPGEYGSGSRQQHGTTRDTAARPGPWSRTHDLRLR